MNLACFRQLKPGYTVRSPHWTPVEDIIVSIETFEDPAANSALMTRTIQTEHRHRVDIHHQGAIALLRTGTSFPVYDEERHILNLDTGEICWSENRDEDSPVLTGTLYNWRASEPIIPGYQDDNDAREAVIEAIVEQAERWAGVNNFAVLYTNIF